MDVTLHYRTLTKYQFHFVTPTVDKTYSQLFVHPIRYEDYVNKIYTCTNTVYTHYTVFYTAEEHDCSFVLIETSKDKE